MADSVVFSHYIRHVIEIRTSSPTAPITYDWTTVSDNRGSALRRSRGRVVQPDANKSILVATVDVMEGWRKRRPLGG